MSVTDMYDCTHGPKKDCHACLVGELVEALESRHYHAPTSCWARRYQLPAGTTCDHCEPALEKAQLIEDCIPIEEAEEASRT